MVDFNNLLPRHLLLCTDGTFYQYYGQDVNLCAYGTFYDLNYQDLLDYDKFPDLCTCTHTIL